VFVMRDITLLEKRLSKYLTNNQIQEVPLLATPIISILTKNVFTGTLGQSPIIILGSNYDNSGVNTNGPNYGYIYNSQVYGKNRY